MNRNYSRPEVSADWASKRETDMVVAVAIHAISSDARTAEMIWQSPTPAEWDHVAMAVEEYIRNGDYDADPHGYCWGQETINA